MPWITKYSRGFIVLWLVVITVSVHSRFPRWILRIASLLSLKTKGRQFDNFIVNDGTVSCHYDNLQVTQVTTKLSNWRPFVSSDWCNRTVVPISIKWPCMIWIISTGIHDDVIKWNHFPRYWPFVRRIHRSSVNSSHKGQWRGAFMFLLICAWINGSVNNREAAIRQQAINRTSVDSNLCCHMVSLVHAMACQLFGAKPLPEPMLTYHMILGIF